MANRDGVNARGSTTPTAPGTPQVSSSIPDMYAEWSGDWEDPVYAAEKYSRLLSIQTQPGRSQVPRTNAPMQGYQQGSATQRAPGPIPSALQPVNTLGGLPQVTNAGHTHQVNPLAQIGRQSLPRFAQHPVMRLAHQPGSVNNQTYGVSQQNIINVRTRTGNSLITGPATLTIRNGHPGANQGIQAQLSSASNSSAPILNGNAFNNSTINVQAPTANIIANTIPATINSLQAPPAATRLAGNTNVSTRVNNPNDNYGNQIVGRPPVNVAPPYNIDISMLEICVFFPSWVLIPEVAMRAQQNEWTRKELAKAQFDAVNMLATMSRYDFNTASNRIQKQTSHCGMAMFKVENWNKSIAEERGYVGNQNLTANNWRFKSEYAGSKRRETFGHMALRDIYRHVPRANWPKAEDRLILTKCLEFAETHRNLDLDTSHYGWIMQVLGLVPDGNSRNATHDQQAVERLKRRLPRP